MKHLNKAKRFLELFVTAAVLAGCSKADTSSGSSKAQESQKETGESAQPAEEAAVVEGQDVNNGRPFNWNPVKYDERDDKYLNGVNATRFPISDSLPTCSSLLRPIQEGRPRRWRSRRRWSSGTRCFTP